MGKKGITIEYIKEQMEKEGYILLSTEYVNNSTKLKVKCPFGHEYEVTWGNFQQGKRCSECAGTKLYTIEYIKEQIENTGYKLLSNKYINAHNKLKVKCPFGHEYEVTGNNFQRGKRCSECAGLKKLTIEFIRELAEKDGNKLLSKKYVNAGSKLEFQCPEGHKFWMNGCHFQRGQRCNICNKYGTSKAEIKIQKYTKTLINSVICNDKTQIINPKTGKYLELDIWIPELMKAIEYNGKYGHDNPKVKIRDKIKQEQCDKLGIDLLIINEQDFINNKEVEMEKIKQFIKEGI